MRPSRVAPAESVPHALRWGATIAIVSGDGKQGADALTVFGAEVLSEANMVQTTNRFFDDVARLMNDAAGVAQGVRREAETLFRTQAERILRDLAVVQREEFEAVKDMARLAREENEALRARVAALEARLGASKAPAPDAPSPATPLGSGGPKEPPPPTGYFA
jgi:BMFP domain-containing protein YqiC